ncbi:MAG: 2-dehydro-3-deoxygalactonokinase, partial [Rubricella sp.]
MTAPGWIAVDWGTSSLRAWAMDGDRVLDERRTDEGAGGLDPTGFERVLIGLIERWLGPQPVSVIACGMVGSRQGWAEAPYRKVPCEPLDGLMAVAGTDQRIRLSIVPGLSQEKPADVIRGEETQIAGFLSHHPDFDGVLCLPGTHTKWVRISA